MRQRVRHTIPRSGNRAGDLRLGMPAMPVRGTANARAGIFHPTVPGRVCVPFSRCQFHPPLTYRSVSR